MQRDPAIGALIASGGCAWFEIGDLEGVFYLHDLAVGCRALGSVWVWSPPWFGRRHLPVYRQMIAYCMSAYDLQRIGATIRADNSLSLRLAERLGFRREGTLRSWGFDGSTPIDSVSLSIIRSEVL
jgi:RimJ/RimL family protein N-acetyltransferase